MKKILLSLISAFVTIVAYAQQSSPLPARTAPHIRSERKELKREHFADKSFKNEMRIHRNRHELHHGQNGKQHEWNRNHHTRPVRKGTPHRQRPMMDNRRK